MEHVNDITDNVKEITFTYKNKFADKLPAFATGAATLIAALAWNEASKKSIAYYFPVDDKNTVTATLIYAVVLTFIVILILVMIDHFSKTLKESFSSPQNPLQNSSQNLHANYEENKLQNESFSDYKLRINKYQDQTTKVN